jgi:thioester reductase-like protein
VQPISGDLLLDELGLSLENQLMLIEKVDLVINCAASVDFNARLEDAASINIFGTSRVFDLFSKMKHSINFLHVSTAYVNSDMPGYIEEKIYDKNTDAQMMINLLSKTKEVMFISFLSLDYS